MNSQGKPDQNEVRRRGRAVMTKLAARGAVLLPVVGEPGTFGVYNTLLPTNGPKATLSSDLVRAFRALDWIEPVNGGYCISEAGAAWLKRENSPGDPFLSQHQQRGFIRRDTPEGVRRDLKINHTESPLGWLRRRRDKNGFPLIDDIRYEAGEKLRRDFTFARMMPRVTASWSAGEGASRKRKHGGYRPSSTPLNDDVMAAKARVSDALDYIGPELSGVVIDVCCHLKGLEETEKEQGWPQRSGKIVLQIALSRLARYYGLTGVAGNIKPKSVRWNDDDCRPGL